MKRPGIILLLASLCAGAPSVVAASDLIAFNRGAIDANGNHATGGSGGGGNANFLAGTEFGGPGVEIRNFFVFNLAGVVGPIGTATLELQMRADGYNSADPSETYVHYDYVLSTSTLGPGTPGLAAYNDLGGGASYGSVSVSAASNGTLVKIPLNALALAAINSQLGSAFALGGRITTLSAGGNVNEFAWGNSFNTATSHLVLVPSCAGRGDADASGTTNVLDVFYLINHLFAGGPASSPACLSDSGTTDVLDVFYLINNLFAGGPAPLP